MVRENMFGDHLAAQDGQFEPQRKNNFTFSVEDSSFGELIELAVDGAFVPTLATGELEMPFLNEKRYVAGMPVFEVGNLSLKDFVDQSIADAMEGWRKQVYDPATGKVGLARDYKRVCTVQLWGPNGEFERRWRIVGTWPTNVNYGGDVTYADDAINIITASLRYDKCIPEMLGSTAPA